MINKIFDSNNLILGIDPGSLKTGFAILEKKNDGRIIHVSHGTIVLDKKKPVAERLQDLACDLMQLLEKYQPQSAAVEDIFYCENARAALILGQARGAVLAILGLHKVSVQAFSPTAVKSMVIGYGRARKDQLAQMVSLELNIPIPKSPDASDALALALALARRAPSFRPLG